MDHTEKSGQEVCMCRRRAERGLQRHFCQEDYEPAAVQTWMCSIHWPKHRAAVLTQPCSFVLISLPHYLQLLYFFDISLRHVPSWCRNLALPVIARSTLLIHFFILILFVPLSACGLNIIYLEQRDSGGHAGKQHLKTITSFKPKENIN